MNNVSYKINTFNFVFRMCKKKCRTLLMKKNYLKIWGIILKRKTINNLNCKIVKMKMNHIAHRKQKRKEGGSFCAISI